MLPTKGTRKPRWLLHCTELLLLFFFQYQTNLQCILCECSRLFGLFNVFIISSSNTAPWNHEYDWIFSHPVHLMMCFLYVSFVHMILLGKKNLRNYNDPDSFNRFFYSEIVQLMKFLSNFTLNTAISSSKRCQHDFHCIKIQFL